MSSPTPAAATSPEPVPPDPVPPEPAGPIGCPGADVGTQSAAGFVYRSLGLSPDYRMRTDYMAAWDLQKDLHARVAAEEAPGTILLLEHPPVYTAGRRTDPADRPTDGTPVVDVDRGGDITYHGPGQLVGYPIVKLPPSGVGVVDFVRRLEEALVRALAELDITAGRVPHRTGVWLAADPAGTPAARPERKIAAIGIRVARKTTMHGFALNVDMDMSWYDRIIPCGIRDAGVTTIAQEIGSAPSLAEMAARLQPHLDDMLRFEPYEPAPDVGTEHAYNPQTAHRRGPAGTGPRPEGAQQAPITYGLTV